MKASEVASIIEQMAPLSYQESWDNSGFCLGSPSQEVHSALLGLDCTPALVSEAVSLGADMIITHHPLIFGGVKKISPDNNTGLAIIEAIKHGIVVYSSHTNMDKVSGGVSFRMAARLGLENVEILEKGIYGEGLGAVGTLKEPMAPDDFVLFVKKAFSLESLRCTRLPERKISKVALCGGAGKSVIPSAIDCGADAYITGDIPYHDFFTEDGFMIMDIGHFESEIDIVKTIYDILKEKIPTFAVRITKLNNNPVFYY